jgi:hypothetical protein
MFVTGSFAAATTTGNQTVDTGVGVALKAILFFGGSHTATGFKALNTGFFGMATSATAERSYAWWAQDNVATTETWNKSTDLACINQILDNAGTDDGLADFVDFTTGGAGRFTINWSNAPASAFLVGYVALYGTGVSNATIVDLDSPTVTGNAAKTGVGFQPNCAIFTGRNQATTNVQSAGNGALSIGMAVSTTERGAFWAENRDLRVDGFSKHYINNTKAALMSNNNGDIVHADADFISWDADGFTLNWTTVQIAARRFAALCLKVDNVSLLELSSPASTGNEAKTTGFNMANGGVLFLGTGQATANATVANNHHYCFSAGGGASIAETALWASCLMTATTDTNTEFSTSKVLQVAANPATIETEADYVSNDSNGYTVNWTTTVSGRKFFGLAMAPGGAAAAHEEDLWNVPTPPPGEPVVMVYG